MDKTCREAYDVFCQYNRINPPIRMKVKYIVDVMKSHSTKEKTDFKYNHLVALSRYISTTLRGEKLNSYEQHIIMKELSLLNIVSWNGAPALVNKIVESITQK